ncbi:vWA [Fusarium beomiforme]|uniref:VWA n=1 Tax=Fusarium beomiforme TaxID=44412 RepID=A0A9P5A3F4_9HYPO|nr:vWA [Fusarium beomiforme]
MATLHPMIFWDPRELPGGHREVAPAFDSSMGFSNYKVLPPYETSASVRILDLATTMTVIMLFSNTTDNVIRHGHFSFPLPSTSSLTKFRFFIGDKPAIDSKVKPIDKAIADFEGAVHNHKTAALVKEETAEIFTAALGNMPPKTKLKAEISLVMMLKEKIPDNLPTRISSLSIPTYIAPRYGDLPGPHLEKSASGKGAQHVLSINAEAIFHDEVIDVISRTHEISCEHRCGPHITHSWADFAHGDSSSQKPLNMVAVRLEKPISVLDGDFVLDFVTKPSTGYSEPHAYLEHHPTMNDHHALMLTIPSNILVDRHSADQDSEILFLADLSGSMSRDKRSTLKSAMKFFFNGIPVHRRFNVWSFGTEALDHVASKFDHSLGGTELLPALKAIFESRPTHSVTTDILLLTDGEVWHEKETIDFVNSAREHSDYRVRFFCLGIGAAVSHSLVEGIAKAGGGYAEVVPADSRTGWEDRVVLMLKAALHTHIGPIKIDIGEEIDGNFRPWADDSFLQSPTDTSLLSPFVTNKVLMLFEATGLPIERAFIHLRTTNSSKRKYMIKPSLFHAETPMIHQLVARELVRDLEHGRHWLDHPSEALLRREGERIACKWSLVSKWTGFVAVEAPQHKVEHNALSDALLDKIESRCQIKPRDWVPDLMKPIGRDRARMVRQPLDHSKTIRRPRTTLATQNSGFIVTDYDNSVNESSSESETDELTYVNTCSNTYSGRDDPVEGSGGGPNTRLKVSAKMLSCIFRDGSSAIESKKTEFSAGKSPVSVISSGAGSHITQRARGLIVGTLGKGNKLSVEKKGEDPRMPVESLGWPVSLTDGSHSQPRDNTLEGASSVQTSTSSAKSSDPTNLTVERASSVPALTFSDESSVKTVSASAMTSMLGARVNDSSDVQTMTAPLLRSLAGSKVEGETDGGTASHGNIFEGEILFRRLDASGPDCLRIDELDDVEQDLDKRAIVQTLVDYQCIDGSFAAMPVAVECLVSMFGSGIRPVLGRFLTRTTPLIVRKRDNHAGEMRTSFDVCVAVLTIALLEKHCESCRPLWSLMANNAAAFVRDWLANFCTARPKAKFEDLVLKAEKAICEVRVRIKKRQDQHPSYLRPPSVQSAQSCSQRGHFYSNYSYWEALSDSDHIASEI